MVLLIPLIVGIVLVLVLVLVGEVLVLVLVLEATVLETSLVKSAHHCRSTKRPWALRCYTVQLLSNRITAL